MSRVHYSSRGEAVNLTELLDRNPGNIAVGNSKVNARGDRLGAGGRVIKTVEEMDLEYQSSKALREIYLEYTAQSEQIGQIRSSEHKLTLNNNFFRKRLGVQQPHLREVMSLDL